jgi:nucleoid DNA-binding protein
LTNEKKTVTKVELAQRLVESNPGLTEIMAKSIITDFFKMIASSVANGRVVEIRGFGSFAPVIRKAKVGYDMVNKASVALPAYRTITLKPFDKLKELMNRGFDD